MLESDESPLQPQSLISRADLERMGNELIRLCDNIERHGLVDYEYGVWEERILASKSPSLPATEPCQLTDPCFLCAVLQECMDLCATDDSSGNTGSGS